MTASLGIRVIRSSLVDWWSMKKECRHARHSNQLTSLWVFVPPLAIRKLRNWGLLLTRLRYGQCRYDSLYTIYKGIHRGFYKWKTMNDLYDVKPKEQSERCVPYCKIGNKGPIIAKYCARWRRNFKELTQDGEWADFFLKTSAPLSLMTTYRMSLISAWPISLNSTFNSKATYTIFSVLYISVVVILHAFVLLWGIAIFLARAGSNYFFGFPWVQCRKRISPSSCDTWDAAR